MTDERKIADIIDKAMIYVVMAIVIIAFAVFVIGSFTGTWQHRSSAAIASWIFGGIIISFIGIIISVCMIKNGLDADLSNLISSIIAGFLIVLWMMFMIVTPWNIYALHHTVNGPFTVADKFMGKDDYTYLSIINNDGKEAWIQLTTENSDIEIGNILDGHYVEGKHNNKDGEYYEYDFVLDSIQK